MILWKDLCQFLPPGVWSDKPPHNDREKQNMLEIQYYTKHYRSKTTASETCLPQNSKKKIKSRCHTWRRQMGNYQLVLLKNVPKREWDRSYMKCLLQGRRLFNLFFFVFKQLQLSQEGQTAWTPWALTPLIRVGPAANNWACLPPLSSFSSLPSLEETSWVDRTDSSCSSVLLRIYRTFHLVEASEINYQGLTIYKLNGFLHILEDKSNKHQENHLTDENAETQRLSKQSRVTQPVSQLEPVSWEPVVFSLQETELSNFC